MSLNIYLKIKFPTVKRGTGIFIRDKGQNRELSIEEVKEKFPEATIEEYEYESEYIFDYNITHNLTDMAEEADLYKALWRPYLLKPHTKFDNYDSEMAFEDSQTIYAEDLIPYLEAGLHKLHSNPEYYKKFNPKNGWGNYDSLFSCTRHYLDACKSRPKALVEVSR